MNIINEMTIEFLSLSANESFARATTAAFIAQLDPSVDELEDIKTAVSEAVTNSIIHGYEDKVGTVRLNCKLYDNNSIKITVEDFGKGIENIELARQPEYTSKPELERSGMGFCIMESFMDNVEVFSELNKGTKVVMRKRIE